MSQRLLISLKKNVTKEDDFYDCIYTEKGKLKDLLIDWCNYDSEIGGFCAPWKIVIRDYDFFDQFQNDFLKIKEYIPLLTSLRDCWTVRDKDGLIGFNENIIEEQFGGVESIIEYLEEEE